MYIHTYIHVHTHIHTLMCLHMYIHTYVHTYMVGFQFSCAGDPAPVACREQASACTKQASARSFPISGYTLISGYTHISGYSPTSRYTPISGYIPISGYTHPSPVFLWLVGLCSLGIQSWWVTCRVHGHGHAPPWTVYLDNTAPLAFLGECLLNMPGSRAWPCAEHSP